LLIKKVGTEWKFSAYSLVEAAMVVWRSPAQKIRESQKTIMPPAIAQTMVSVIFQNNCVPGSSFDRCELGFMAAE
jgi:hypothetical protein